MNWSGEISKQGLRGIGVFCDEDLVPAFAKSFVGEFTDERVIFDEENSLVTSGSLCRRLFVNSRCLIGDPWEIKVESVVPTSGVLSTVI
jgi:hypothetical protein